VLRTAGARRPRYLAVANALGDLVGKRDWPGLEKQLLTLFPQTAGDSAGLSWATVLRNLLRQIEVNHKGLTQTKKREGLERVLTNFDNDPDQLLQKIHALIASWGAGSHAAAEAEDGAAGLPDAPLSQPTGTGMSTPFVARAEAGPLVQLWRDLLIRTLELGLLSQLRYLPELTRQAQALLDQARASRTEKEVEKLGAGLKSLWYQLEMNADAQYRLHEELLHLLRLLVENMGELVVDDQWLHGQTEMIRDIIAKPLDIEVLYDAESSLKELIFKQGKLKHGLVEAKDTLKQMAATFVSRLAEMTRSTGVYHEKIEGYHQRISATEDITELNMILDRLMVDTRAMQLDALRSHEELKVTQQKVEEAEQRIQELTGELDRISEAAHADYLTGALNRRGMDEALEREFSRADRLGTELCLAMMDIDHFKKLNDTLGHATGDVALAHLAKVTRSVLRPTDVLARYGGEEFIIILPETEREEGVQVITRLQRELTKNFFLHENEKVLITFSAGVAQRQPGEDAGPVMKRADAALYQAKQSGRNRVIGAD
ncbi:MAG: GGDEF domain-containing protein, partial [Methylobacterium sp.]|nr:GGDEF domain-containing protein [Methylobacterium sp.]